jgi:hypothetical protein
VIGDRPWFYAQSVSEIALLGPVLMSQDDREHPPQLRLGDQTGARLHHRVAYPEGGIFVVAAGDVKDEVA